MQIVKIVKIQTHVLSVKAINTKLMKTTNVKVYQKYISIISQKLTLFISHNNVIYQLSNIYISYNYIYRTIYK